MQKIDKTRSLTPGDDRSRAWKAISLYTGASLSDLVIFDIETTGLSANVSSLYLIGALWYDTPKKEIKMCQWFADDYTSECTILEAFSSFVSGFSTIVHYNGSGFDIPYLEKKMSQYHINCDLTRFEGIDIYRRIAPYKEFLHLPNCKQKTIEGFLHTDREDTYTGGELIDIYHEYVLTHDSEKEHFLLLHNAEDIKGMLDIIAALAIPDLIHEPVKVIKVHANYYNDIHQQKCPEIIMSLKLPTPLPTDISYSAESCYFIGSGDEVLITSQDAAKAFCSCSFSDNSIISSTPPLPIMTGTPAIIPF